MNSDEAMHGVAPSVKPQWPELDNPVWHALITAQQSMAQVSADGRARRFERKVSTFGAIDQVDDDSWAALRDLVGAGRGIVLIRADETAEPDEWERVFHARGVQYVCGEPPEIGDVAPAGFAAVELGVDDVSEMLELTALAKPGPFYERTREMGRYLGVRQNGRLVAMAGERLRADTFTEISAVSVHPDARRQGLAAALTTVLARDIQASGRVAMLHVLGTNDAAHAVYQGIGFAPRRDVEFTAWRHRGSPAPD